MGFMYYKANVNSMAYVKAKTVFYLKEMEHMLQIC